MGNFSCKRLALVFVFLFYCSTVVLGKALNEDGDRPVYFKHQRRALAKQPHLGNLTSPLGNLTSPLGNLTSPLTNQTSPLGNQTVVPQNASSSAIQAAKDLVASAVAQQGAYNKFRIANPRRNTYRSDDPKRKGKRAEEARGPAPPALTKQLLAAAALVAEHDAKAQEANGTLHKSFESLANLPRPFINASDSEDHAANHPRAADDADAGAAGGSYWVPQLAGKGRSPMGGDANYPVFRDVTKYGAKGDGVTDDTKAINAAMADGNNCGEKCLSSSIKGTLIYFPAGTYLISAPINAYYYSQMIGDANDPPIIKTSASFIGLGAIQSDVYIPNDNGNEWYIEQSNFYRQVRNFVIDIRDTTTQAVAGLHWQVAQATSLTHVAITASTIAGDGNTQMGMFTENGSGGFMSDVTMTGGAYGIYGGNQQYTVRNFQISGQNKANICLIWDWGWTWSGLHLSNAPIGISLINPLSGNSGGAITGSTYVMDSQFEGVSVGIKAQLSSSVLESSIITLDNIKKSNVGQMIEFASGTPIQGVPTGDIDFIIIGNKEQDGEQHFGGWVQDVGKRPSTLVGSTAYAQNLYYAKSRPQYENLAVGSIVNVKDHGAKGDGVSDDTAAIKAALALATTSNLIYFPPGSYIVTSTIVVAPHTRMTGSVWSQLVASGSYFGDASNPKVMLQVGANSGDSGTVEISDMLFTSIGSLPGLIMMEWNVKADSQGSVGIWDAHFRVGGAIGTKLQVAQCPASGSINSQCVAANMMMHVTSKANGYFENVWAWVADHDIDDAKNTQITVVVARGMLIESAGPNWLYGTASEHSILYQYNFEKAANTFAGMIQTESPYYQAAPSTGSPGPFKSGQSFPGDPTFPDSTCKGTSDKCNFSWAVMMQGTTNLTIAGAGLYSWFDNYVQTCVDTQDCQQRLIWDDGNNSRLQLWNLITIGAVEMVSSPSETILAKPNTQANGHPFWSALAAYLDSSNEIVYSCAWEDTTPDCLTETKCDTSKRYATLDDLAGAKGKVPDQCMDYYALNTLYSVLNTAMSTYTSVNNGYDAVFGDYRDYMKDLIPETLSDFMGRSTESNPSGGPGNKYFDCSITGHGKPSTQKCPFSWQQLQGAQSYTITFKLTDSDGFYKDLLDNYGIEKDWVSFGRVNAAPHGPFSCPPHDQFCIIPDWDQENFPIASSNIDIPNPKDIISKALPNIDNLRIGLLSRSADLNTGIWNGSADDLMQVYSMPVFLIDQAVAGMEEAKKIGQQVEKEKKIQLIVEVLTAVFSFIPFLDDVAPALGIADGVFTAIGDIGNVALTIQSIVSDPKSAPMAILGLIGGAKGSFIDRDTIGKLASARRALSDSTRSGIGKDFKKDDDSFQGSVKRSCRT